MPETVLGAEGTIGSKSLPSWSLYSSGIIDNKLKIHIITDGGTDRGTIFFFKEHEEGQ